MPLAKLLKEENWIEYDNKKIKGKPDSKYFACTELWEVNYLKKIIKESHPQFTDSKITEAIQACCKTIGSPHPRKTFVECVLKRLGVI